MNRTDESLATALGGAVLGGLAGRVIGCGKLGLTVGAIHGGLAGWRGIYDWRRRSGRVAFALDHTWALVSTGAGLVVLGASHVQSRSTGRDAGYEASLSERQNRFVHRGGVVLRRGFAVTVGTVIDGAADASGSFTERRRKLVTDHEDVHVWQQRLFGPIYPVAYGAWFAAGAWIAVVRRFLRIGDASLRRDIDSFAYYRNPFEWHAYTCDDNWPPGGADATNVWTRRFPLSSWVPRIVRGSGESPATPD